MKLRNKETGEVKEVIVGGYPVSGKTKMWECSEMDVNEETGYKSLGTYSSLAELNEEWEDYEEPKPNYRWFISGRGTIEYEKDADDYFNRGHKTIGNYFETKEEAEKAVEKLKAWKRLKDKGFRFERWLIGGEYGNTITFSDYIECNDETRADLDLLFGGEE